MKNPKSVNMKGTIYSVHGTGFYVDSNRVGTTYMQCNEMQEVWKDFVNYYPPMPTHVEYMTIFQGIRLYRLCGNYVFTLKSYKRSSSLIQHKSFYIGKRRIKTVISDFIDIRHLDKRKVELIHQLSLNNEQDMALAYNILIGLLSED